MIPSIQALRFFAAFAVVCFHLANPYFRLEGTGFMHYVLLPFREHGRAGVDVFFVLSGFVIWYTTASRHAPADIPRFAWHRAARIYLGYWPWLVLMFAVVVLLQEKDLGDYGYLRSIFLVGRDGKLILPVSWTLTFELMFYAYVAASMLLPRSLALAGIMVWGLVTVVSPPAFSLFLSPFIAQFAAGVLIAELYRRNRLPYVAAPVLLALSAVLILDAPERSDVLARVTMYGALGCGAVVAALWWHSRKGRVWAPLEFMGDASYAIYLAHLPLFAIYRYFWRAMRQHPDLMCFAMLVTVLVVSAAWYRWAERPLYVWATAWTKRPRPGAGEAPPEPPGELAAEPTEPPRLRSS